MLDGHNDLAWALRGSSSGPDGYGLADYDLAVRQTRTHTDLVRLAEGGVGAQFWSVYVPASLAGADAVTATLEQIDAVQRIVARYPDRMAAARTADDVRRAFSRGQVASLMGAEGGHSIDGARGGRPGPAARPPPPPTGGEAPSGPRRWSRK